MSRRLAEWIRNARERLRGWEVRRALARSAKRERKRRRRERIKSGEPESAYEGVLAAGYELRALIDELRALSPRVRGRGKGFLAGASDVIESVDEAAGDLDLDGEPREFGGVSTFDTEAEREIDPEREVGFDPWTAGETRRQE